MHQQIMADNNHVSLPILISSHRDGIGTKDAPTIATEHELVRLTSEFVWPSICKQVSLFFSTLRHETDVNMYGNTRLGEPPLATPFNLP